MTAKKAPPAKPKAKRKPRKTATNQPSPNGDNGRDKSGRFVKGNPGGPGNPHARQVAELRSAAINAVTPDDIRAAVEQLVAKSRNGELAAIKELLDRVLGKANQPMELSVDLRGKTKAELRDLAAEELRQMGCRVEIPDD